MREGVFCSLLVQMHKVTLVCSIYSGTHTGFRTYHIHNTATRRRLLILVEYCVALVRIQSTRQGRRRKKSSKIMGASGLSSMSRSWKKWNIPPGWHTWIPFMFTASFTVPGPFTSGAIRNQIIKDHLALYDIDSGLLGHPMVFWSSDSYDTNRE